MKKKEKEMTTEKKQLKKAEICALIDDCERNARQGRRRRGIS